MVVVAAGRKPVLDLREDLGDLAGTKVILLGDANQGGTALDAIYGSVEPALHVFD